MVAHSEFSARATRLDVESATGADGGWQPAHGSRFGHIRIENGKSKNAKRNLSLTERVREMLERRRKDAPDAQFVFGDGHGQSFVWTLDRQHAALRDQLRERLRLEDPSEFVVYSFRHSMLTRLGESGADAFTIMKIAGHSDIRVSAICPPVAGIAGEGVRATGRLESLKP